MQERIRSKWKIVITMLVLCVVGVIHTGIKVNAETETYGDFEYQVYNTAIADYRDEKAFPLQNEEEILMLYTCYPVDNVWYVKDRFIAYAKLVGDDNG